MLDRERILAKLDQLESDLGELRQIIPESFAEYMGKLEKRRACERVLQISIECMIDICGLIVAGLRLGLPAEEEDVFEKLEQAKLMSPAMLMTLRSMRGFRNILVHEYGGIDNSIVFKIATTKLQDLSTFQSEVLRVLREKGA
ncbi:MAG: type VII toxin-antitoxin system HepT family RNase toxin [Nitrospiraceae bacterium]